MKRQLRRLPHATGTLVELQRHLTRIWNNIQQRFHANLLASMRRRCTAVVDADGGYTRYWECDICVWPLVSLTHHGNKVYSSYCNEISRVDHTLIFLWRIEFQWNKMLVDILLFLFFIMHTFFFGWFGFFLLMQVYKLVSKRNDTNFFLKLFLT